MNTSKLEPSYKLLVLLREFQFNPVGNSGLKFNAPA